MRITATLTVLVLLVGPTFLPTAGAHHSLPKATEEAEPLARDPGITWRAVSFAPSGSHALLAGDYTDGEDNRSVLARWSPDAGIEIVINRTGPGFVDVVFDDNGRSLVVGLKDTILLGAPGSYEDIWDNSSFAQQSSEFIFYGLGAGFQPGARNAVISGSSLLEMAPNGSLDTIHGGRGAFFRTLDWNPVADFAYVEAAIQRDSQAVLGTVWRTDGHSPLAQRDNVAIYGRFNPGSALLNAIEFAPNGSFALLSGRDGAGASILTWSSLRTSNHTHADGNSGHDHRWRYQSTAKERGPVTCIDWHPSGRWALTTGLTRDVLGVADAGIWTPLMHRGPDLYACAMHPSGDYALAAGENGSLVRVDDPPGPVGRVVSPAAGSLVAPQADQTFRVGVIDRSGAGDVTVTGQIGPDGAEREATLDGRAWKLEVNTSDLRDGRHELIVEARTDDGTTRFTHPFLVNNERFTPTKPQIKAPTGLEGQGSDADGVFTINWQPVDEPVVYEVQQERTREGANATKVLQAGGSSNLTVRVDQDGTYVYRVRSVNAFNQSDWSRSIVLNVVIDSDGDGVPDRRDPQPHIRNAWGDSDGDGISDDVELNQCSDPNDANSTPAADDDGDGIPNGRECLLGSDANDPDDPTPREDPGENATNGSDDRDAPGPGVLVAVGVASAVAVAARRRRR